MKRYALLLITLVLTSSLAACFDHSTQIRRDGNEIAEMLRSEMKYIQITAGNAPALADTTPAANYVLTLVGNPYLFNLREYWIETLGDPTKIHTQALCIRLDSLARAKIPLAEVIKQIQVEFELNLGPFSTSFGANSEALVESIISAKKLSIVKNSTALIVVRGYADGEERPWSDTLRPDYPYEKIAVFPPTEGSDRLNPFSYRMEDSIIHIRGGTYTNSHLPDLRAEFVRRVILLPTLRNCGEYNVDVRIIKGAAYTTPNQPQERKVQVFVYLFENR